MLLEQLGRIDLNLLIILQVLLEERNGSRAARRLHLSQSAVSKALGRLRETFDDPLFVRSAYGLEPTARALSLQQQLQPILLSLDNLLRAIIVADGIPVHTLSGDLRIARAGRAQT